MLPRPVYLSPLFDFYTYPPSPKHSDVNPIMQLYSRGDYNPLSLSRVSVRAEVSHTHQYPYSEASEGEELHSAMHTILDSAAYKGGASSHTPATGHFSDNSSSPAFPNGYGRTNSSHGKWKDVAKAVPIPIPMPAMPYGFPNSQSVARSIGRIRSFGDGLRSPRTTASVLHSHSEVNSGVEGLNSLSFEEDDTIYASLPPSISLANDDRVRAEQLEGDGIDLGFSGPPLSSEVGSSDTGTTQSEIQRGTGSPETSSSANADEDVGIAVREEEDEWDSFKLDGVDEEHTRSPGLLVQPLARVVIKASLPTTAYTLPSIIKEAEESRVQPIVTVAGRLETPSNDSPGELEILTNSPVYSNDSHKSDTLQPIAIRLDGPVSPDTGSKSSPIAEAEIGGTSPLEGIGSMAANVKRRKGKAKKLPSPSGLSRSATPSPSLM